MLKIYLVLIVFNIIFIVFAQNEQPENKDLRNSGKFLNDERDSLKSRKRLPKQLDHDASISKPWEDENQNLRPIPAYKRRRLNPIYEEQSEDIEEKSTVEKITEYEENNEKTDEGNEENIEDSKPIDLKSLLKQNGGLSLSEILQQKNLSLSDLLTNKQSVINIIKKSSKKDQETSKKKFEKDRINQNENRLTKDSEIRRDENEGNDERKVYQQNKITELDEHRKKFEGNRLTKVLNKEKTEKSETINEYAEQRVDKNWKDNNVQSDDLDIHENYPEQFIRPKIPYRKRLPSQFKKVNQELEKQFDYSIPAKSNENDAVYHQSDQLSENRGYTRYPNNIKHFEVVTEATTEKRVFIPTFPRKHYNKTTENSNKPFEDTTSTEQTRKPYEQTPPDQTPSEHLIIKENGLGMTRNKLALKPRISFPSKNSTSDLRSKLAKLYNKESSLRINLNENITSTESTIKNCDMTTKTISETSQLNSEIEIPLSAVVKSKYPNAKNEIMEVLKSVKGRQRLAKILASKNMTINELVELRERGSSQLHLADIFHNQTKEPNPNEQKDIVVNVVRNHNILRNNFRKNQHHTQTENYPLKLPLVSKNNNKEANAEVIRDDVANDNYFSSALAMQSTSFNENLYRESRRVQNENYDNLIQIVEPKHEEPPIINGAASIPFYYNSNKIDEIIEELLEDSEEPKVTNHNLDEDEPSIMNSKIKSAILVSLAIVIVSLLIFISILFACKYWQQREKKLICYTGPSSNFFIGTNTLNRKPSQCMDIVYDSKNDSFDSDFDDPGQKVRDNFWKNMANHF